MNIGLMWKSVIITLLIAGTSAVAGESKTLYCTSPWIPQVLQSTYNFVKSSEIHSFERQKSVERLVELRTDAENLAWVCTLIFAFNMAVLLSIFTLWILNHPRLNQGAEPNKPLHFSIALYLTQLYLAVFIWGMYSTKNANSQVVETFAKNLSFSKIKIPDIKDPLSTIRAQKLIIDLALELDNVPKTYRKHITNLAPKNRWWSLGWDQVAYVDFELAATRALQTRFQQQAEKVKVLIPKIKNQCHPFVSI